MPDFKRYAVYYAPPAGPLADFAASWLGWDSVSAELVTHPEIDGLPLPVPEITEKPRKYGFHGTLKAPFQLAEGSTEEMLKQDLSKLAKRLGPVTLEGLELSQLGRFLALTPIGDPASLQNLAAEVVSGLDSHRKPTSLQELNRRRSSGLSPQQDELLTRWGYPYVMDQFRFHMTLTGKLKKSDASTVKRILEPILAPLLPKPFSINDISLFGEAEDGMFHLIERYALGRLKFPQFTHQAP